MTKKMLKSCFTSKFKKDFKRIKQQGKKLVKLEEVMILLQKLKAAGITRHVVLAEQVAGKS